MKEKTILKVPLKSKLNYQLPYGCGRERRYLSALAPRGWVFFFGKVKNDTFFAYGDRTRYYYRIEKP